MTKPKRPALAPEIEVQRIASYIRPHTPIGEGDAPPGAASSTSLADAADDEETFLDQWLAHHFSLSVKLFDITRGVGRGDAGETLDPVAPEAEAVLADLELVQDVLFELREFAAIDARMRTLMHDTRLVQNGVVTVYAWLEETLAAVARSGASFRRSPSFVDASEGGPPIAMLRAFERLHPDLEMLVAKASAGCDPDVAHKLALCFRQIGAAVVRISGHGATTLPPNDPKGGAASTQPPRYTPRR